MDTTDISETAAATNAPLDPDDPRALFARAVALGGTVIGAVRPDQLSAPTPCREYDVRQLLGHLVEVLRRVAAIGREEDPFSVSVVVDVPDDSWQQAWSDAAHEVQAAWSDDAVLSRIVRLPWSELPGGATLAGYTNEVTVHTWDLATATGQRPSWDDRVLDMAFDGIRRVLPAEGRAAAFEAARRAVGQGLGDFPAPFDEAVEVGADAALIDRLVAWNGRHP